MALLWSSDDISKWQTALDQYDAIMDEFSRNRKGKNVKELDDWMRDTLVPLVESRSPAAYLTQTELSKLMSWKLSKGKWYVV